MKKVYSVLNAIYNTVDIGQTVFLDAKSVSFLNNLCKIEFHISPVTHIEVFFQPKTGFVPFLRNKFPGLPQDSDLFSQDSKIHINPFTTKISMLILLTVCHTFNINFLISTFQDQQPFTRSWKMPLAIKFQQFSDFRALSRPCKKDD